MRKLEDMLTDLERRRRAIADALRAIMAEPHPHAKPVAAAPQPIRSAFSEPQVRTLLTTRLAATAVTRPAAPHLPPVREALAASVEWDELEELVDSDDVETPAVPPLEVVGSMSKAASMALFGHA
jgi:hypothetical protein